MYYFIRIVHSRVFLIKIFSHFLFMQKIIHKIYASTVRNMKFNKGSSIIDYYFSCIITKPTIHVEINFINAAKETTMKFAYERALAFYRQKRKRFNLFKFQRKEKEKKLPIKKSTNFCID